MLWKSIEAGGSLAYGEQEDGGERSGPGGSLYVRLRLQPGEEQRICLRLCWHVPWTDQRHGQAGPDVEGFEDMTHRPWYAGKFAGIGEVEAYWRDRYDELRGRTELFSDSLYRSDVPDEILEAVAGNLTILKSPTVMRQPDGRLWAWEGSFDTEELLRHLYARMELCAGAASSVLRAGTRDAGERVERRTG